MSLRQRLHDVIEWTARVVTQPRSELTRWQRTARFHYDLSRHGARKLRLDDAPQMAGALAFRTLFGLLPVLIVGTILVRAFQGSERLQQTLGTLFQWVFHDGSGDPGQASLSTWLMDMVARAQEINLTALGWVGTAVLVYSAVGLMVTIENAFNTICRAPCGRSWFRRLPVYWTLLTLGPLALGATLYANAQFEALTGWHGVLSTARALWGFSVLWLLMLAVYRLMPATSVELRPAMAGALVCALLLTIGQHFLGAYLGAMQSIELWGSVGLIPLFMFWVYVMWLAVLFGLEVAATLQLLRGRELDEVERLERFGGLVDAATVVPLMQRVAQAFALGEPSSRQGLAAALGLPEATVALLLEGLAGAGLLHRLGGSDEQVALARPPERIGLDELIEVGFALVDGDGASVRTPLLDGLRAAQRAVVAERTLAEAC